MTITLSAVQIFLGLATLVGGAGTIGAVVSAGVAHRWVLPLVRAEILRHAAEAATVEAQERAITRVIDAHVQREDGLVRRHTREQGEQVADRLAETLSTLADVCARLVRIETLLDELRAQASTAPIPPTPAGTRPLSPPLGTRLTPTDPTPVRGAPRAPRKDP